MASPILSAVIPLYNQGEYVREAVDSVRASTLRDVELIVVDDGSTDPVTKEAATQLENEGVTVVRQANAGLSAARNAGISRAVGRYVMALDADDRIDPTYLEKAVWILERYPEVGFIATWVQCFGLSVELWAPIVTAKPHDWWLQNRSGPAGVFRRELWQRAGGYDTGLLSGYEDWDFWLRLLEVGALPYQLPEPLFYYRVKSQSMYIDALANHEELVRTIRQRHPEAAPRMHVGRLIVDASELARRFAHTPLGSVVTRVMWRDVAVVRHEGLAAWIKWRGYQAATPVPGAVTAYRTVRKIVRPQVLVNNNDNRLKRAPVALRVNEPSGTGILFIVPWLQVGGADKVNLDLLRKLDRRKYHPVLLTTLGRNHPQLREFQKCCDDIFHLASFPASAEEHLDLISHLIRTRNVGIVQISNSERAYQLLPQVKASADVKVLSLVHSYDPRAKRPFIDIAVASDEWVDRHVAVSERVASMLRGRGVSGDKVLAIANGVDTALFAPGQSRWLSDRGSRATTVITFVGRLVEEKDPLLFVAAVEELLWRQRLDDVAVIVVGDGPLREVVRAKLGALRQTCEVFSLGACSEVEVAEILKCTTVLVAPSLFEGLPLIGLEAMASAVPIVATRVSGWQELLRDGVTGRLVERDAVRIADATAELLRDRDKAGAMGERARAVVVRDYSVDDMAKAYEELWAQLLSERSAEGRHDRKGPGEPLVGGANRSIS